MAFDFIAQALQTREQAGYLRARVQVSQNHDGIVSIEGQHYLNFASNDYLGMSQHPEVLQTWVEGLARFGAGSGASPLVTGYSDAHHALESYLADKLNREAVLLFNSGFAANQAVCQALFQAGQTRGTVIADRYIHASFIDGAMSCNASFKRFHHNDNQHLSTLLGQADGDVLVASEGVFSMDGDTPDVPALVAQCQQHNGWLMIDDAHGFGVLGESGLGVTQAYQLDQQQLPVLMATFGKAVGTAGAFVAGSQDLINYLVNFARHYVYSTNMPSAQALATLASLQLIEAGEEREKLHSNIALFRSLAAQHQLPVLASNSAIQPIVVGDPKLALAMSGELKQRGVWVPAMRHPTVPKGTDRLRVTLSAVHSERDIHALVDAILLVRQQVGGAAL